MDINIGNRFIHNGKQVTCTAKHASGKWFSYHFSDGWSFTGDPAGMLADKSLIPSDPIPTVSIKSPPTGMQPSVKTRFNG